MDRKKYVLIGVLTVTAVFLSILVYGSNAAFRTSGTPKVTYFEFGKTSLPVRAYEGTYQDIEALVGNVDKITVYYIQDNAIAEYLKTVDYDIHSEKLGFFDKFMVFCHKKGTEKNPVILTEKGDLSITIVRKNVFIIRAQNADEIENLFNYASQHLYDHSGKYYEIKIPFSLKDENFTLSVFSGVEEQSLRENQNRVFTILREPLISSETKNLYLFHSPWEEKGKENSALAKGVVYISKTIGAVEGPDIMKYLVIDNIMPLDKLMIYMEIIGTEESPLYYVRTAADNAEKDGIYIPRKGFIYLEVVDYKNIEKYCMGLATILGGS